jgi:hypothetical protein
MAVGTNNGEMDLDTMPGYRIASEPISRPGQYPVPPLSSRLSAGRFHVGQLRWW